MHAEMISCLRGPVFPVPPAFAADGRMDANATSAYVRFLVSNGARAVMVTAGTSRLNLLTEDEILELNAAVVKGADGRALVIAANPITGSAEYAAAFARRVLDLGADVMLVYFPERYYSDDAVTQYFQIIAHAAEIPLMLHAVPMRSGTGGVLDTCVYDIDLLEQLCRLPTFIGLKEEQADPLLRKRLVTQFKDRLAFVVAGGGMSALVAGREYGVESYLTSVGNFLPTIETDFFAHVEGGRHEHAETVLAAIEIPLFEVAVPMGWHRAMRGLLAVLNLMPGYERAPLPEPTESELARLRQLARAMDWL
jgi:4-hydroxy-tetrahydrodipicolinate synthase